MADTKISAMTTATEIAAADLVPIVQGGANKHAAKALWFTAAAGEELILQAATGEDVGIRADGDQSLILNQGTGIGLWKSTNGIKLQVNGGTLIIEMPTSGNPSITYRCGDSGDWDGDPDDIVTALDRLAAAVSGLLSAPIP